MRAHREHEGDILAFLPGQADIQRCEELLIANLADTQTQVYPLYGNLSPERQRKAIAPSLQGERKIVLATPIAETSLTIEGVRIVIDSGFAVSWCTMSGQGSVILRLCASVKTWPSSEEDEQAEWQKESATDYGQRPQNT